MCHLHIAHCPRCGKIAACWQTNCVVVDTDNEYRTCGSLQKKEEPPGLCPACLTRGPQIPKARLVRKVNQLIGKALVGGRSTMARYQAGVRKLVMSKGKRSKAGFHKDARDPKNPKAQDRARGRAMPSIAQPAREIVYHPAADQNSHRPNQVLYRAINPTPTTHPSIIRVRNARTDEQLTQRDCRSEASPRSSLCSEELRRTSWPPPRLHMRAFQVKPVPRESFFEAMEDLVPCTEAMVLQSGRADEVEHGRQRPMSW